MKNNRSAGNYFFVTSKEELNTEICKTSVRWWRVLFGGGLPPRANAMPGTMVAASRGSPKVSTLHRQIRVPRDCGGTNVVLPPSQRQHHPTRLDGTPAMLLPAAADASWCQEQSGGTQGQGRPPMAAACGRAAPKLDSIRD